MISLEDRFISKVAEPFDAHNDCFMWTGYKSKDGYGQIWLNGNAAKAHRVSYELFVGPIPEGHQIDHMCRNRACVRPDHLQALPHREHKGQGQRAKTHCPVGHPYDEKNTYLYEGRRYCRACHRVLTLKIYHDRKAG